MLSKAIDATFENIAILRGLIQEGKLRALGAQNKTRTPLLPDMPTMAEAGVPDCEANTFFGLVAPAGTPPSIIKKISDAMNEGLATRGDAKDRSPLLAARRSPILPRSSPPTSPRRTRNGSRSARPPGVKVN